MKETTRPSSSTVHSLRRVVHVLDGHVAPPGDVVVLENVERLQRGEPLGVGWRLQQHQPAVSAPYRVDPGRGEAGEIVWLQR